MTTGVCGFKKINKYISDESQAHTYILWLFIMHEGLKNMGAFSNLSSSRANFNHIFHALTNLSLMTFSEIVNQLQKTSFARP